MTSSRFITDFGTNDPELAALLEEGSKLTGSARLYFEASLYQGLYHITLKKAAQLELTERRTRKKKEL